MTKTSSRVNGRQKGASFERKVAKFVSDWWGIDAHRTPQSGGLRWSKDARVTGDIVAPADSNFPFSIECKKHEGWTLENLLKGTGEITDWWKQAHADAQKVDKLPLLIFSKNRSPVYFMLPVEQWAKLEMSPRNYFITTFELKGAEQHVVVGMFDDLLAIPKERVVERLSA
jgi:Holliday junction resolvase